MDAGSEDPLCLADAELNAFADNLNIYGWLNFDAAARQIFLNVCTTSAPEYAVPAEDFDQAWAADFGDLTAAE